MKPFYISTNGADPKTPGGVALDLLDIRLIGDYSKADNETSGFNVYLKTGECIPVLFSPDVPTTDGLEMHSVLVHDWLLVNKQVPFDVLAAHTAVAKQEDPDGLNRRIAGVLATLVRYLLTEGLEKEDKAAWTLVDEFSVALLEKQGDSVLEQYYRIRDDEIDR